MIAAVRIKGRVNIPREIETTLNMLRLRQKFACSIYKEKPEILGMLEKVKSYISYGKIDDATLKQLLLKRGRKIGNKKLMEKEVDEILKNIKEKSAKEWGIKPFFRLAPPRGGFKKNFKLLWPKGIRGNIGDKINELIKSMI